MFVIIYKCNEVSCSVLNLNPKRDTNVRMNYCKGYSTLGAWLKDVRIDFPAKKPTQVDHSTYRMLSSKAHWANCYILWSLMWPNLLSHPFTSQTHSRINQMMNLLLQEYKSINPLKIIIISWTYLVDLNQLDGTEPVRSTPTNQTNLGQIDSHGPVQHFFFVWQW